MEDTKIKQSNHKDRFVHLHLHDTYSFVDGFGTPEQYSKKCAELGQSAMATTNHGNVSSHFKWYKECRKRNIKPILGCEMYLVESAKQIEEKQREYNHITVLAKNNKGYKNLLKLVTKSWLENFYYKPRITLDELKENQEGLIILSGCLSGRVARMITEGKSDNDIVKEIEMQRKAFDDYYIEVAPLSFLEGKNAITKLYGLAKRMKIPMVGTMDCHYVEKKHSKLHEVLLCIQTNTDWNSPSRWKFDQDDFYLKSREEMETSFKEIYPDLDFTEALDNTVKIADSVEFEFPKATPMKFPMKEKEKISYFKKLCSSGLKKRGLSGNKQYIERAKYEIDMIIQKNFVDYFLIVTDLVQWAKKNRILVGPARGSAAGSLVCYLTEITEVDPLPFDLLFERFIDINREDLPDIDIDFEDRRRHEVKEYLSAKYGEKKVGNIATFSIFHGKSAIVDVARTFKLPFDEIDKLKSMVIERSGGDSRASFTLEDTFTSELFDYPKEMIKKYPQLQYAIDLEGQVRHLSEHASGYIISNENVTDYCAIYQKNGEQILSIDYADAAEIGLVKIDILGIRTLSALMEMKKKIKETKNIDIDYYKLPLDDKKTYKGFCENKLFGVFQFDGQAVNQVCRQIKPTTFEEIGDINALARPGPLNSGSTTMFIERKEGRKKTEYFHPSMKAVTKDTYGIVVYQEQVMKTMREVGNMSWKDTAEIRKLISRSQGVEKFNTFKEKFAVGARENGLTNKEIDTIWSSICTFGCLSGETVLEIPQSNQHSPKTILIKDLFKNNGVAKIAKDKGNRWAQKNRKVKLLTLKKDAIKTERMVDIYKSGIKTTYKIITESGEEIRATMDHQFYTPIGYKKLEELHLGDLVATKGDKFPSKKYKGVGSGAHNKRHGQSKLFLERQKYLRKKYKLCQVCFKFKNEETHHRDNNRMNNNWENLVPICRKCHKKTCPTPIPFKKGFQIRWSKIESIYSPKREMTYDIAMPYPWNNYIANNFVVHNSWAFNKSHSISYAYIAYWTMYMKMHHPLEFYSVTMSETINNEKIRKIVKECRREGIKILPIDIQRSKESFSIDNNFNGIRVGFSQIKGIGEKTAKQITENQPYSTYNQFLEKNKFRDGTKIVSLLKKIGAFGAMKAKIGSVEYSFGEPKKSDIISLCPYMVELNLHEKWNKYIEKKFKVEVTDISNLSVETMSGQEGVYLIGIITEKNYKNKKEELASRGKVWIPKKYNGKEEQPDFLNFNLEDDDDFITIRVGTYTFPEYRSLFENVKEDDVVIVGGKMGSGIRMFFMNEVVNLSQLKGTDG